MKKVYMLIFIFLLIIISGCDRKLAREYGGTEVIKLEKCQRLVPSAGITWGDGESENIWFLTEEDCNKPPKKYTYQRSTTFKVFEGKLIIEEQ